MYLFFICSPQLASPDQATVRLRPLKNKSKPNIRLTRLKKRTSHSHINLQTQQIQTEADISPAPGPTSITPVSQNSELVVDIHEPSQEFNVSKML